MSIVYHHKHCVGFSETDAAGIAHFSRFGIWVEEAETAFWRDKGIKIPVTGGGKMQGFPKIKLEIRYRIPARAGDIAEVSMTPTYAGRTSITWNFTIACGEHVLADGSMTVVYATIDFLAGKILRDTVPAAWAKFLQ